MSTVSQSVSTLKTALTTLNNYVDTIDTEYGIYVNSHGMHTCATDQVQYVDGSRPDSGHSWHEYRDKVSEVITWAEKYVDDSAWVDALEQRATKWSAAHGHASDAWDDVDPKNLPAVDSWRGPAGRAYREVVPQMQAGAASAFHGTRLMKSASTSVSEAGESFFTDVAAAASTLAGSLTRYVEVGPPPSADGPPSVGQTGAYSCGLFHDTDDAGSHPWTALTTCEDALTTLESQVTEALRVAGPGGPSQGGYVSVPDYFTDTWPPAPGGS